MRDYEGLVTRLRSVKDTWQTEEEQWMLDAADAIEELSKPKWISVDERLPEPYTEVLAFVNDGSKYCEVLQYDVPGDGIKTLQFYRTDYDGYPTIYSENVVAWMPLPKPPKEET